MKKIKYIMLAVVLCLGLIGGAYAYWTDQVVVSGSVATGDIDVVGVAPTESPGDGYLAPSDAGWENYVNPITALGKTISFDLGNLYPRAGNEADPYMHMIFGFKNEGSIPVSVKDVTLVATPWVQENVVVRFNFVGVPATPDIPLSTVAATLKGFSKLRDIQPGETAYVQFQVYLKSTADNTTKNQTGGNVSLTFAFAQWNDPTLPPITVGP